jgi:hypothetical protein
VKQDIYIVESSRKQGAIANVPLNKGYTAARHSFSQRNKVASTKVIYDDNLGSADVQQLVDQMRTDQACASGNKCPRTPEVENLTQGNLSWAVIGKSFSCAGDERSNAVASIDKETIRPALLNERSAASSIKVMRSAALPSLRGRSPFKMQFAK